MGTHIPEEFLVNGFDRESLLALWFNYRSRLRNYDPYRIPGYFYSDSDILVYPRIAIAQWMEYVAGDIPENQRRYIPLMEQYLMPALLREPPHLVVHITHILMEAYLACYTNYYRQLRMEGGRMEAALLLAQNQEDTLPTREFMQAQTVHDHETEESIATAIDKLHNRYYPHVPLDISLESQLDLFLYKTLEDIVAFLNEKACHLQSLQKLSPDDMKVIEAFCNTLLSENYAEEKMDRLRTIYYLNLAIKALEDQAVAAEVMGYKDKDLNNQQVKDNFEKDLQDR